MPTKEAKERLWNFSEFWTFDSGGAGRFFKFFSLLNGLISGNMYKSRTGGSSVTIFGQRRHSPTGYTRDEFINLHFLCHGACYEGVTDIGFLRKCVKEKLADGKNVSTFVVDQILNREEEAAAVKNTSESGNPEKEDHMVEHSAGMRNCTNG